MPRQTTIAILFLSLNAAAPAAAQTAMVGGAFGQTVRVVVTADAMPAGMGCAALTQILTRDRVPAAEELVRLRPGESNFVEVNLSSLVGGVRRRVELLPAVKVLEGQCTAAVEIYENITGRTMAYVPGLLLPASGAPLSAIGVSLGQILRLSAASDFDPQPDPPGCRGVLAFADAGGNPVGPSRSIDLEAGASSFIDLDPSLLLPASGDPMRVRRFVRPQLLLPASGGGDTRGCHVSVQLFDRLTGWTSVALSAR